MEGAYYKMNILLTGAFGFIGREIAKELTNAKIRFDVCDTGQSISKNYRYMPLGYTLIYDTVVGSIPNNILREYDCIIHCGAISNSRENNFDLLWDANYNEVGRLLSSMKHNAKLIFFSSASVYGDTKLPNQDYPVTCAESKIFDPQTKYAFSKLSAEKLILLNSDLDQNAVILRPFNVYGPGEFTKQDITQSIVYKLCAYKQHLDASKTARDKIKLHSLDSSRDYVSVKVVSNLVLDLINKWPNNQLLSSRTINVGSCEKTSLYTLTHFVGLTRDEYFEVQNPWGKDYQSCTEASIMNDYYRELILKLSKEFNLVDGIKEIKESIKNA